MKLALLPSLPLLFCGLLIMSKVIADNPGNKLPAAGIMYLCDDAHGPLKKQATHFNNPSCNGVIFRTAWNEMEPSEGTYNWSKVDAMLSAAQAAHKILGLGVTAGFRSPSWLADSGAQMMTGSLVRSFAPTQTVSMPWPWDPVYLNKWGAFLNMLGQRYDQNPNLAYIAMAGMGFSFEPFMAKTPADLEKFTNAGGLPAWIRGSEEVIDLFAHAFPRTPFLFVMHWPITSPEAHDALATVVNYGLEKYPGRFGVMFHGLDARASDFDYFDRTIHQNADKTTVGYQMVWSTTGINAGWLRGSLDDCLESGVRMKAHFIEVYGSDCDDPQYGALLQRVGGELKSQSGVTSATGHNG